MRKMAQDGLINYSAHEYIDLTSQANRLPANDWTPPVSATFSGKILDIPTETANAGLSAGNTS
jgi:Mn-dependent DtxR family transcriptional regulator